MTRAFPLFRLGTLLVRQLSKPVASMIKVVALQQPWFGREVCARAGRVYHALQLRLRLWTLALRQPRHLPPLSKQAALDAGADILGEVAMFGLGGLIIIFEVNRQAEKQENKLLDEESRWVAVLLSLEELQREMALQQQDIERLQAALHRLAPRQFRDAPPPPTPPASSDQSAPLTSELSTLATSDCPPPPPTPKIAPPPLPDCPPPPLPECPQPAIPDCPSPVS